MRSWTTTLAWVLVGLAALLVSCRAHVTPTPPEARLQAAPRPPVAPPPPPSLSLTDADGTGLVLTSVDARVVLEDPLAFTELELWFQNPRAEQVEGRFEILLPQGAQVTRFAMQVGDQLQEAEVVEKQYARQTYEAFVHEERDPALLERDTGNRFRARVFPIEPYEDKRIIVSYAQPLTDPHEPYRLAAYGLPWLHRLSVRALVREPDRAAYRVERHELEYEQPTRDVVIAREAPSFGGIRRGDRVIARLDPLAEVDPGEVRRFERLTVLVDTSASRAIEHDDTVEALGRLLRALTRHSGTAQLEILAFDQEVVPIYDGPLGSMGTAPLDALHARRPLGASNLELALAALREGERDRVLLVTDGLVSAGTDSEAQLRRSLAALAQRGVERVDVLRVGSVRDDQRLRHLVNGPLPRAGVLLDVEDPPDRAAMRMALPTLDGLRLDVPGATWWYPHRLDGLQPGDHVLVHAELPEGQPLVVQVTGPIHAEHAIALQEVDSPLVDHAWMYGRVQGLVERIATLGDALETDRLRALAVSLSVRHRIFNDFTAFLVLETEEDYARFGLDRRALSDILVVGGNGIAVEHRGAGGEPEIGEEGDAQGVEVPAISAGHDASIVGVVRDQESGRTVADALVVLQCSCLPGGAREAETDAYGRYGFDALPAGTYTIQVLHGQSDVSKVADVGPGERFTVAFRLPPQGEYRRVVRVESKASARRSRRRDRRSSDESGDPMALDASAAVSPMTTPVTNIPAATPLPPAPPPASPAFVPSTEPTLGPLTPAPAQQPANANEFASREFEPVQDFIDTTEVTTADSTGISLAGTTGVESVYHVDGATISEPAFGGGGLRGAFHSSPEWAGVYVQLTRVRGKGLRGRTARSTLRSHLDPIERCYYHALTQRKQTRGRTRVELRLDESGRVIAVDELYRVGLRSFELRRCVYEVLRDTTFPLERGRPPRVRATLVFDAKDGPPTWYEDEPEPPRVPSDASPAGRVALAEAALDHGRWRDAWTTAVDLREAAPTDVRVLIALGRAAEAAGQTALAARAYGSILDLFPSRADMLRHAAGRLEALDEPALALAIDAYRRARAERPDHPSSHRNLAFALLRQGDPQQAFEALEQGLLRSYPPDRFAGVSRVLREDLGIVAAAWLRRRPTDAPLVEARLAAVGATLATEPSLRFVLTWETDANDVDLHVVDAEGHDAYHQQPTLPGGGELFADVSNGYGPECFAITGPPRGFPYRVRVHYFERGPMGHGLGKVQVVHHDGRGEVVLQDRSFVITSDGGVADLGQVEPLLPPAAEGEP
ncbi:MAG: carboxypeptidase regulatory-like domain-containing protein [Myxococcales bacterium]|nr:carboxypeptidase regulatory-like domain-containing protein [Myxococcales bacterium]